MNKMNGPKCFPGYRWVVVVWLAAVSLASASQGPATRDSFQRNFNQYGNLVKGVDFYAPNRTLVAPFEKPFAVAVTRLHRMLGDDLPPGAVVICNSAAQRDSVAEERVLRLGYKWVLIEVSAKAQMELRLEQIKARMGDRLSPEMIKQIRLRTGAQDQTRWAASVVPRMSFAVAATLLAPEKAFKTSRVGDLSRSPLADWIDIGLSRYAADSSHSAVRWTQRHLDEIFPLEDLLDMNRPFVLPDSMGGAGRGGGRMRFVFGGQAGGGGGRGGAGTSRDSGRGRGDGDRRGGDSRQMPKEVQDRLNFDNQAALFFAYLIEKVGTEKTRKLVQANREGEFLVDLIVGPDYLGKQIEEIEEDWTNWVKEQKAPEPRTFRMSIRPDHPPSNP